MGFLLVVILLVLVILLPPGTSWTWNLGGVRMVFPVGWCLLCSLVLSLLVSILGRR